MAKDFHDPSVFTDNVSALDLFNNSVRKSFNYDALTGPTYFAKVLSTPLPLNADQMASMLNLDPKVSKTAVDAATKANQKRVTSFYFKGRIEQLHGQFLDDPCDLSTATCPHAIKRLISDHTEFISEGINSEIPAVGDIVRVQLKPASNGPYDLQSGAYLGPTRTWSSRSTAPGAGQSEQCYSAVDNFDEENASTMGEMAPGSFTPTGAEKPLGPNAHPNSLIVRAWAWLSPLLPQGSIRTSAVRTQESKDRIIRDYARRNGIPTTDLDYAHAQLKAKGYDIARYEKTDRTYGHGSGYAFDISGADLDQIAAIVNTASGDSDMKVSFRGFTGNPSSIIERSNNAVHVEILSAEEADKPTIMAAISKYMPAGPTTEVAATTPVSPPEGTAA